MRAEDKGITGQWLGLIRAWSVFCRARRAVWVCAVAAAMGLWCLPCAADTARLTLGVGGLSFPSADPDVIPLVEATENPVSVDVWVRGSGSGISNLSCFAAGDLVSGSAVIPIDRVSWVAQGNGFISGVMSKIDSQPVGQWFGKNVNAHGSLSFRLLNSWNYETGFYTQSMTYTLISY